MGDPMYDEQLDSTGVNYADPDHVTDDGEQVDALVMFADCWDDPEAVEQRRVELIEWANANA